MILLGLLMYLAPMAIWTQLIEKTWVKIVVTFTSVFALIVTLALWTTHNELEECEDVKSEIVDVMYDYSDCVDYSVDRNDYEGFVDCGCNVGLFGRQMELNSLEVGFYPLKNR